MSASEREEYEGTRVSSWLAMAMALPINRFGLASVRARAHAVAWQRRLALACDAHEYHI